jgi:hypothetical protein
MEFFFGHPVFFLCKIPLYRKTGTLRTSAISLQCRFCPRVDRSVNSSVCNTETYPFLLFRPIPTRKSRIPLTLIDETTNKEMNTITRLVKWEIKPLEGSGSEGKV